jgi:hypothetical protein
LVPVSNGPIYKEILPDIIIIIILIIIISITKEIFPVHPIKA